MWSKVILCLVFHVLIYLQFDASIDNYAAVTIIKLKSGSITLYTILELGPSEISRDLLRLGP